MSAQTMLSAVSFACLMEFGVRLLHPSGRARMLHTLPAALLTGWFVLVFFVLLPLLPDRGIWQNSASALEIFDLETERFIESMEQQQILSAEREQIAWELHDGVIQKIYTARLLVESAEKQTAAESPAGQRLEKAVVVLNDAIADLRRNLGELRAVPSGRSLYHALRVLEEDPRLRTLVDLQLDLDLPANEALKPARPDAVMAIVNEALSNAIRHAGTRRVKISARRVNGRLKVTVEDDGVGLPRPLVQGYGLRNMRDRARARRQPRLCQRAGKGNRGPAEHPLERRAMSKIQILLVDDHAVVRLGLTTLIDDEPNMQVVGEAGTIVEIQFRKNRLTLWASRVASYWHKSN